MTVNRHPSTGSAVTVKQWRYTATGGETTLTGTDGFSQSLAYTVGAEEVYVNGVLLERAVDYTATTGTSVVLTNALVAGDIATVMSANAFNVANAIPNSTVTAKGDLIVGNGAASVTNLGVGADGSTLVANSSASTGMGWAGNQAAGRNAVINGGFDIWQRSTSSTSSSGYNTADRWVQYIGSGSGTYSQETSVVPANARYALKFLASASNTGANITTYLETSTLIPFIGKTVTISSQVAATTSTQMSFNVQYSTTVDAGSGATWTTINPTTGGTATPTSTTYVPMVGTYAIPSNALGFRIIVITNSNIANGVAWYLGNVQMELGSTPTTFTRAGGTLQGELAACRRYLPVYSNSAGAYSDNILGYAYATNAVVYSIPFDVPARTAPTGITLSGTFQTFSLNSASTQAITYNQGTTNGCTIIASPTITAGQGSRAGVSANGYILFTGCEL